MPGTMTGKVCLVTGATRGIGKGIALQLGEAGAKVYITGRTLRASKGVEGDLVGGCLEDTAEEVEARGGRCIPVKCDHANEEEVAALFDRIEKENNNTLDLLVNNAYAAIHAISKVQGMPFWEHRDDMFDLVNKVALRDYYYCTIRAARIMAPKRRGLIVNISSIGGLHYFATAPYGINKAGVDRIATDCAVELRPHNVAMLSMWPGTVKTEMVKYMFESDQGVTTDEMTAEREQMKIILNAGETIEYSGKCVVALATDPKIMKKSGRVLFTGDLGSEYGFRDVDGKKIDACRALWIIMLVNGWNKVANFIPRWVKIPCFMLDMYGSKF